MHGLQNNVFYLKQEFGTITNKGNRRLNYYNPPKTNRMRRFQKNASIKQDI